MKIQVTLRYLTNTLIVRTNTLDLPSGTTAGELTRQVIQEEEETQAITFSGASIVTLINGRIAAPEAPLRDGDEVRIMPVAAAG